MSEPVWLKWGTEAKKLGAAVYGLAAMIPAGFLPEPWGTVVQVIVGAITASGVYALKNEPKVPEEPREVLP